ncbi:MAG: quinoprotein dehydrogenase-associated putative ABC transporter substrate-binding protein [Pyrinomonadaceae bacterium]|nr:quinoprotein dehydrogenase-associated putative ABC transporter substrate-binding protein [Pyrinomonadaceae bacterium]
MSSRSLKSFSQRDKVSTACASGRVLNAANTRPLPQAVLTCLLISLLFQACARSNAWQEQQPQPSQNLAAQQQEAQIERPVDALRVCADPNNLPFSNRRGEGFENKIAELLAREMNVRLEYTWAAQRRGFFRNTLKAGLCDVVIGVPSSFEMTLTTAPYYRSTYVFVYRRDRRLNIGSFDDAALRNLKIGVQMIGDDFSNTPPAHALTNRGMIENVRGYMIYGDYSRENPTASIIEAVAKGEIDVAVVWGPTAGYFAKRQKSSLEVVPVKPEIDQPFLPFVYDISVGVRRNEQPFRERIEQILRERRPEIQNLLKQYGVPEVQG